MISWTQYHLVASFTYHPQLCIFNGNHNCDSSSVINQSINDIFSTEAEIMGSLPVPDEGLLSVDIILTVLLIGVGVVLVGLLCIAAHAKLSQSRSLSLKAIGTYFQEPFVFTKNIACCLIVISH